MGTIATLVSFTPSTTIRSADVNSNYTAIRDVVNTYCVLTDTERSMTVPINAADGVVGAPGIRFVNDQDCGIYRIGANNIGIAVNGAKVLDIATTGVVITGTVATSGAATFGGTVSVGNTLTVTGTGELIASVIRRPTADASDTEAIWLNGGGGNNENRGAQLFAAGNEYLEPGLLRLASGNVAGGKIAFRNAGADVGHMGAGVFAWGLSAVPGASHVAGDVILASAKALRFVNAAGTDTLSALAIDGGDAIYFGETTSSFFVKMADPTLGAINRRVTLGAADSGGAGYRVLRVPNT